MIETKPLNQLTFDLPNEKSSQDFAGQLAACLLPATVITFSGDLGSGKTTIIRAMLRALGICSAIKSPTFSLVESYDCQPLHIHHFDLYRIQDEHELEYLGFRDYFEKDSVCCIEWPEKAGRALSVIDLHIILSMKGAGRSVAIEAFTAAGNSILTCLKEKK